MSANTRIATLLIISTLAGCNRNLSLPSASERGGVSGVIVKSNGASAEGVPVQLIDANGSKQTQSCDATGAFTFSDLVPGTYFIDVRFEGFLPLLVPAVRVISGTPIDVGTLTLTAQPANSPQAATLTGKVVTETGAVPEGAQVELTLQQSMQRMAVAVVTSDGTFTERVPAGRYILRATHPLYVTAERRDVVLAEAEVRDLTMQPLSLPLNPATLTGKVVVQVDGDENAALAKQGVLVTLDDGQTTTTDVMGRFMMSGLAGGTRQLRFTSAGYVDPIASHPVTLTPGQMATLPDVKLNLRRGVIRGTVALADQQPAQGIRVEISGNPLYSVFAVPMSGQASTAEFRLVGVPLGTYEVAASKERYSRAVATSVQLTEAAPNADVGALTLSLLQGTFRIDDGDPTNLDGYTRQRQVTLDLSNFGSAQSYRASTDYASLVDAGALDAGWQPFVPRPTFVLPDVQGAHTVWVQYSNAMGVSLPLDSRITLDSVPPSQSSVAINAGKAFTNSRLLSLALNATDPRAGTEEVSGVFKMRVSTSSATTDAGVLATPPDDFRLSQQLTLPAQADGPARVFAQFFDGAGNASPIVSAGIVLDTLVPQVRALRVRDGGQDGVPGFTNVPAVVVEADVDLAAEPDGGAVVMKLANSSAGLGAATYVPFSTATPHNIDVVNEGLKTVFALFRDEAGNETQVQQTQVTYDVTPPGALQLSLLSGPDAGGVVTLQVGATDTNGLSLTRAVTLSEDPLFGSGTPRPMPSNGQLDFTLSAGQGTKQVLARFIDVAGNASTKTLSLTVDTISPVGTLTLTGALADGTPSTSISSSATVTAAVDASDAVSMVLTGADLTTCPSTGYGPVLATSSLTLQGTGVTRTATLCLRDAAGNVSQPIKRTLDVDALAPASCTLALRGVDAEGRDAGAFSALPVVTASLACGESGLEVALSSTSTPTCSATALLDWRPLLPTQAVLLAGGDGLNTVAGCVRDRARNTATLPTAQLTLDTTPPSSTLIVLDAADGGQAAAFINAKAVAQRDGGFVDVTGFAVQASSWAFSQSPDLSSATWLPFPPQTGRTLLTGEGVHTVYAAFKDALGNTSSVVAASIALDTRPPDGGQVLILTPSNNGRTNTVSVQIGLSQPPLDAVAMQLVESDAGCPEEAFASALPQPLASGQTFLLSGGAGTKVVCARFFDEAGNASDRPPRASVVFDPTPPTVLAALELPDGGALTTATRQASLRVRLTTDVDVTDYALFSELRSCGDLTPTEWLPFTAGTALPLTLPGSGDPATSVTLTACVRDSAFNTGAATRTLRFDAEAPQASLVVGDGSPIQRGTSFAVALNNVSADVTQVAFGTGTLDCATASYSPFVGSTSLSLADGTQTVKSCVRDAAGNATLVQAAPVIVDNGVPTTTGLDLTGLSAPASGLTNLQAVTLVVHGIADATSGVTRIRVASDPTFSGATFVDIVTGGTVVTGDASLAFNLEPGDGPKTVYVQVQDRANNVSSPRLATVTLDQTKPVITQAAPTALYAAFNATAADVSASATDNLDTPVQLTFAMANLDTDCPTATYSTAPLQVTPLTANQWNSRYVCVKDRAGNVGHSQQNVRVFKVPAAPSTANFTPNPPSALASGAFVSWTDTNTFTEHITVKASKDPTFATGVQVYEVSVGDCTDKGNNRLANSARVGLRPNDTLLENWKNWFFQYELVDCAGTRSTATPAAPVTTNVVPNMSQVATVFPEGGSTPVVYSDGDDVWLHRELPPVGGARIEEVAHCKATTADCRSASSWKTLQVPLFHVGAIANNGPASMLATDDALFLTDATNDNFNPRIVVASCPRTKDCDLASNWSNFVPRQLSGTGSALGKPVILASGTTVAIFYVSTQQYRVGPPFPPNGPLFSYIGATRCWRSSDCASGSGWTNVDSAVAASPTSVPSGAATDTDFYVGFVSSGPIGSVGGVGPTAANQPMFLKCEHGCISSGTPDPETQCTAQNGNCGCDGSRCGYDFRFSRFNTTPVGSLRATAPTFIVTAGQPTAAWAERDCPVSGPCTTRIVTNACGHDAECFADVGGARAFDGRVSVASWLEQPSVTLSTKLDGPSLTVANHSDLAPMTWLSYFDPAAKQGVVRACNNSPAAPCINTTTPLVIAEQGQQLLSSTAAAGENFYAVGLTALGTTFLAQPLVPTASRFVAGPLSGAVRSTWLGHPASTTTTLSYGPINGGFALTQSTPDPFTTQAVVNTSTAIQSRLTFSNANGIGDPARTWATTPFETSGGPPNAVTGQFNTSVASSGPTGNGALTSDPLVYVAHPASTGGSIGRCNTSGSCGSMAAWQWGALTGPGTSYDTVSLTTDYPRNYTSMLVSHSTPRLFAVGRAGSQLWLHACVKNAAGDCTSTGGANGFTAGRLDLATGGSALAGSSPVIRTSGDYVQVTEPVIDGLGARTVQVRFCDGSYLQGGTRDPCRFGGLPTNKPLNHCANLSNWKSVVLPTNGLDFGSSAGEAPTGMPHPVYGYLVAQPTGPTTGGDGFRLFRCNYQANPTNQCGEYPQLDCSTPSNWLIPNPPFGPVHSLIVNTGGTSRFLDMAISDTNFHETRLMSEQNAGIYVSYFDATANSWNVAQCRRNAYPNYLWDCFISDGTNPTRPQAIKWAHSTVVPSPVGQPIGSTIRVIGSDLVATFAMTDRTYVARCAGGLDCATRAGWNVYVLLNTTPTTPRGQLAEGINGDLVVGFTQASGASGTSSVLSGGKLVSK